MDSIVQQLGVAAAVLMPFWNIPLIVRIIKRKTSEDISLWWLFGVWICILFMFPSTLVSRDLVLKAFGVVNTVFFTGVVVTVLLYRKRK